MVLEAAPRDIASDNPHTGPLSRISAFPFPFCDSSPCPPRFNRGHVLERTYVTTKRATARRSHSFFGSVPKETGPVTSKRRGRNTPTGNATLRRSSKSSQVGKQDLSRFYLWATVNQARARRIRFLSTSRSLALPRFSRSLSLSLPSFLRLCKTRLWTPLALLPSPVHHPLIGMVDRRRRPKSFVPAAGSLIVRTGGSHRIARVAGTSSQLGNTPNWSRLALPSFLLLSNTLPRRLVPAFRR